MIYHPSKLILQVFFQSSLLLGGGVCMCVCVCVCIHIHTYIWNNVQTATPQLGKINHDGVVGNVVVGEKEEGDRKE